MILLVALVLSCQEDSLQALMGRWTEDDPARRDDASRRIVSRWNEWKDNDLAKLRAAAAGGDVELAGRAKDALATIQLRRRLGVLLLEKLPDAGELVVRGTPEMRLTLLVRATELWEKRELGEESLRALAESARDAGWTLDGHAFLEHVQNRGVRAYVPLVVPFLRHSDPAFRGLAAQRLGRLGARETTEAVVRLLEDPDPTVCAAAVQCLGEWRATDHYPKLVPLLNARASQEVLVAVNGLLSSTDARPCASLVAGRLSDADRENRLLAIQALGGMGAADHAGRLAKFLEDPSARHSAFSALSVMGAADQAEKLVPFLQSTDVYEKIAAARALGRMGRPDLIPNLIPLLKESGSDVAWTATQAILDLGPREHVRAFAGLLKLPSGTGLAKGLIILGRLKAREYAKEARALVEHHQPMVRAEAAKALALMDPAGCVGDLTPLFEDQFEAVRLDACLALASIPRESLKAASREAAVRALEEARRSFSGTMRAAAAVAWACFTEPESAVRIEILKLVEDDFSDAVLDALLDDLGRAYERETQAKLDREIVLEKPVDSWERLDGALASAGLRLEGADRLTLSGRAPAGIRTTPRMLLRRFWEEHRPVPAAGAVRLLGPERAMEAWKARLAK